MNSAHSSARLCTLLLTTCLICYGLIGCASKDDARAPAGTATTVATATEEHRFEDYDDEHVEVIADPLEPWNRFWFGFNDIFILQVLKPVYGGYVAITPVELRSGFSNLLQNIQTPVRVINRLLQGEVGMAGVEFGRFIVNSTVGFGGLINVAAKDKPLVPFEDDGGNFNRTLAVWGAGEGMYLVWPLFGPSTVRGTVGLMGDYAASPFFWGTQNFDVAGFWIASGAESALKFNNLGGLIDAYESLTKIAVEPYTAVRDAYIKYQRSGIEGSSVW